MPAQIGLGTGLSANALKSELVSPLAHRGISAPLQMYFRWGCDINRHHVQLQYLTSELASRGKGLKTHEQGGYLQYAYHRRAAKLRKNVTVFGGAVATAQGVRRENVFRDNVGNNTSGELIASLSPSVLVEVTFKNDKASAQVWSPVVAFAKQPSYALGPESAQGLGLGRLAGVDWRLSYDRWISKRWGARFDYQFQFYRLSVFERVVMLRSQFMISMVCKIN